MNRISIRINLLVAAMTSATFVGAAEPPKSGRTADPPGPSRYAAPNDPGELGARLQQLRLEYAPYLRSLPGPAEPRPRTLLNGEWQFTFEVKDPPKRDTPPPPAPDWPTDAAPSTPPAPPSGQHTPPHIARAHV